MDHPIEPTRKVTCVTNGHRTNLLWDQVCNEYVSKNCLQRSPTSYPRRVSPLIRRARPWNLRRAWPYVINNATTCTRSGVTTALFRNIRGRFSHPMDDHRRQVPFIFKGRERTTSNYRLSRDYLPITQGAMPSLRRLRREAIYQRNPMFPFYYKNRCIWRSFTSINSQGRRNLTVKGSHFSAFRCYASNFFQNRTTFGEISNCCYFVRFVHLVVLRVIYRFGYVWDL